MYMGERLRNAGRITTHPPPHMSPDAAVSTVPTLNMNTKRRADTQLVSGKTKRWTEDEDAVLKGWTGKVKDLVDVLEGRAYTAIRSRLVQLGTTKPHVPWSWNEDTLLREAPIEGESRMTFYERVLPHRGYFNCHHRYEMYIAPLLGKGRKSKSYTRFENHVKLARSEAEVRNLRMYYDALA